MEIQKSVKIITDKAASFFERHLDDEAIHTTFGYFTHHPFAPLNQKRLCLLLSTLERMISPHERPRRILDLGCGGGLVSCAIAELGHQTLGCDSSSSEIRLAKLFAAEEKLKSHFMILDLVHDPTWERKAEAALGGKPDLVILAYALHHIPKVVCLIERLGRWVPPGCEVLINEENPDSFSFKIKHKIREWIQKDTDQENHKKSEEWRALFEAAGFTMKASTLGVDLVPGLSRLAPHHCWSVFLAAVRS